MLKYLNKAHKQATERLARDLTKLVSDIATEQYDGKPIKVEITPECARLISALCSTATTYWTSLEQPTPARLLENYQALLGQNPDDAYSNEVICE